MNNKLLCFLFYSDTPHHLKNKRVQHDLTDKKANEILANALNQEKTKLQQLPPVQSPIQEETFAIEQSEQLSAGTHPFEAAPAVIPLLAQASTPLPAVANLAEGTLYFIDKIII